MKPEVFLPEDYRPAEDEPFMNARQLEYFRRKLTTWKQEILDLSAETIEGLQDSARSVPDLADRASEETDRALELRTRDRQRKLVAKIDAALRRIDKGEYGYCEVIGRADFAQASRRAADRDDDAGGAGEARAPRAGTPRRLTDCAPGGRDTDSAGAAETHAPAFFLWPPEAVGFRPPGAVGTIFWSPRGREDDGMTLIGQRITVLGGGIAGLTVAVALAQRGAAVTVLEQAEAIREVGAGLQISPNGAAVLRALGLGDALAEIGQRSAGVVLRNGADGAEVLRLDLARLRPGQPYDFVHRADLIGLLANAARDAGVQMRLLQKIEAVTLGDHPPRLTTAQGALLEAPLLIGADGLHSVVRSALNGKIAPFFTHQVAWRATLPATPGIRPEAQVFMGPGRHLVSYPLRGGTLRNIVAVEQRHRWAEESWTLRDDPIALRFAFAGFCAKVRGWLEQVEDPYLWGLFRHPVAPRWHGMGATIVGDAAHPTLPFLAQGANMALEDAWVLAAALAGHDSAAAGFAAYQQAREARVRRIVEAADRNARAYHLSGLPRVVAHLGLRVGARLAPAAALGRFDWLYGHDVTAGAGAAVPA